MKYRKKIEIVEARILEEDNISEILRWCNTDGPIIYGYRAFYDGYEFSLITPNGLKRSALIGDYIIQSSNGEFNTCKPEILDLTYEPTGVSNEIS